VRRYDGVIFDMDGTLVRSPLDFRAIRRELGIAPTEGILEAIAAMPTEARRHAERRLLEIELEAARQSSLTPGAGEVLRRVAQAGLKTALLTRNAGAAMEMVLARFGLRFDLAWSREFGPIKPEPDGILRACRTLGLAPARVACVGDFRYDVMAARSAGAASVLLLEGDRPDWAAEADCVIDRLEEILEFLGI